MENFLFQGLTSSTYLFSNSIIMRDIMQQFAAVLDEHPPLSSGPSLPVSTAPPVTATATTSSSNSRMVGIYYTLYLYYYFENRNG